LTLAAFYLQKGDLIKESRSGKTLNTDTSHHKIDVHRILITLRFATLRIVATVDQFSQTG
jgi:hypothetical protein